MKGKMIGSLLICFILLWGFNPGVSGQLFTDMSGEVPLGGGSCVAWGDYDNDGHVDLLVNGGVKLYKNDGAGGFIDVTEASGLSDLPGGTYSGVWGDFNNDGFPDIFAAGSGPTWAPDYLIINQGDGTFDWTDVYTDFWVTAAAGWGDYNNDGLIDLYVPAAEVWSGAGGTYQADVFYENRGDGTFEDMTQECGLGGMPACYGRSVAWCDYDEDGDQDVYISNYRLHPNFLWDNQGDGTFIERSQELGIQGDEEYYQGNGPYYGHTIGSAWGDINNDGDFDLVTANLAHGGHYLEFSDITKVYLNNGAPDYDFMDWLPESSGITYKETHSSPAFADFDHDGDLDVVITCVYNFPKAHLYENLGNAVFQDITDEWGIVAKNSWGAAWADYDEDGDLDLIVSSTDGLKLCRNDASDGAWVKILLTGKDSNKAAVGARVDIETAGLHQARQVEAGMGTCSSQNSPFVHFGLGSALIIDTLTITWPSGLTDAYTNLPVNTTHFFEEDGGIPRGSALIQVVDSETQDPVACPTVKLNGEPNSYAATGDGSGEVAFDDIRADVYTVSAHADGYFPGLFSDITVTEGGVAALIIEMTPAPPLSGTYTIDPVTGDFESLGAAVDYLHTAGATGPVVLELNDGVYQEGSMVIEHIEGTNETDTVTIKPAEGSEALLEFNIHPTYHAGLILKGCDYIVFDGHNGVDAGKLSLSLIEEPGEQSYTVLLLHSWLTENNAFKNCRLLGYSSQIQWSNALKDNGSGTLLESNVIGDAYTGVHAGDQSDSMQILNNDFGGDGNDTMITMTALKLEGRNAVVKNNRFHNIHYFPGKSRLEVLSLPADSDSLIVNNLFYDINNTAGAGVKAGTYVIFAEGASGSDLFHNSIYLKGDDGGVDSWCLYVSGENTSITARNNCFYNVKQGSKNDVAVEVAGEAVLTEDHNFLNGIDGACIGFSPDDTTVTSGDPAFYGDEDLHIHDWSACQNIAALLPEAPLDFEGDQRLDSCDAGADENTAPVPTSTPTIIPTPAPTVTPTELPCDITTVSLEMPAHHFTPGMNCSLSAVICNCDEYMQSIPLIVLLEVYGEIWFAPSWINSSEGFDCYTEDIPAGITEKIILDTFPWPDRCGQAEGLYFYAGLTDNEFTELIGQFGSWEFGFSEE